MTTQQQSTQINEGREELKRNGINGRGRQTILEGFTPFMQPITQTIPPGAIKGLGSICKCMCSHRNVKRCCAHCINENPGIHQK